MASSMTVAQLEQARTMITSGDVKGFYQYMADQGYNYALLAGGLVNGSFSGEAAINYLEATAKAEGVTFTAAQVPALEQDMAGAWLDALENVAKANGVVSGDLSYQDTLSFHAQIFGDDFGLSANVWTLTVPGNVLGNAYMQSLWEEMLSELSTNPTGEPIPAELKLTTAMAGAANNGDNLYTAAAAQAANQWLATNAYNIGSDLADVWKAAMAASGNNGTPIDGGTEYTDGAGVTLDQYVTTLGYSLNGFPQTVTENVWSFPVGTSSVSISTLTDGTVINRNAGSNVSVSSQGMINVSNSAISIGSGDSGAGEHATLSGDNNTLTTSGGNIGVTLLGNYETINSAIANDGFAITGTHETFRTTGDQITFNQGTDGVVAGDYNAIAINGSNIGVTLLGNYETINSAIANDGFAITGTHETFRTTGDGITFNQGTDAVVVGDYNSIAANGSNVGVTLLGNYETIDSAITNDGFAITGTHETFRTTGDGITFNAGSDGVVAGDYNSIATNGGSVGVTLLGNYETINSAIANDGFAITGTHETFRTTGDGITFNQGTDGVVYGDSNTVGTNGTGIGVTLMGNYNTVQSAIANDGFAATGTHNTFWTTGDGITFNQGSDGVVYGDSNSVAAAGSGIGVTMFGNGFNVSSAIAGDGFAVTGTNEIFSLSGDNVVFQQSSTGVVSGNSNAIAVAGDGCKVQMNGTGGVITVSGNNEIIQVTGAGNLIVVTGTNDTIYANGCEVDFQGNAYRNNSDILYGSNNTNPQNSWSNLTLAALIGEVRPPQVPQFVEPTPSQGSDDGVYTYPVPDPGVTSTPLPDDGCSDGMDPVILNLNGGSVQTASLDGSSAYFDMQNNGQKVQTGWATAGEGMLVYDPTDSGTVTDDAALVGGFDALKALDSNSDGEINAGDAAWNSLKVWVDPTGTANFQSGELFSLSQLGITSINLNGQQVNENSNGNEILVDSTFTYANGSTGDIAGVNLMFNPNAVNSSTGQTTASLADLQISNLILSMAAYGAQPAASSALVAAAQQTPQAMLATSSH
jgi:hypothetical protein